MTLEKLLGLLRRKINETDLPTSDRTDAELLDAIQDAAEVLGLRQISGMSSFTVQSDATKANYGITPLPTTEQAHLLALLASLELLRDDYRGRLSRGELGISWKSGLEEESSISAEKAWRDVMKEIEQSLDLLIIMNKSSSHATRPQ